MAEAQQPHGQNQQPQGQRAAGQSAQDIQRRGAEQQPATARGRGSMPSLFNRDPFDMLRTSPFALMRRMTEEMDRWFGEFAGLERGQEGASSGGQFFAPPVEMCERDGNFIVCADLPGLSKDDVHVEITDDVLTISGERRYEHEEPRGEGFHSERRYGMFRRQIPLPEGVNAEQATANFKDGVLQISMPAPQRQARSRRIDIQSGTSERPGTAATSSAAQAGASDATPERARTATGGA